MKQAKKRDESLYVPLSEVAKTLDIKPHVLYYWEKKFPQLKPYKIAQRKFYKKEQIGLLKTIKEMLEEGYTLEGIKKILEKGKTTLSAYKKSQSFKKELLKKDHEELLKEVLNELKEIYKSL